MRVRVRAAGAVVLRHKAGRDEVLVVHRPNYDDWSLPKGKAENGEIAPVTAVREVREETGILINLGARLPSLRYPVGKGLKSVDYWRATATARYYHAPDREVDKVAWLPVKRAKQVFSYADEVRLVEQALALPETNALLLIRHAKALSRSLWTGKDRRRGLDPTGLKQARALVSVLSAFGVTQLVSSPALRCVATLAPYADYAELAPELIDLLSEEQGSPAHDEVKAFLRKLAKKADTPTAVCGHRPVLPAMRAGLGLEPASMAVGETMIIHRDKSGKNIALEDYKITT